MTNHNIYPDLPKEPLAPLEPQPFCINIIQSTQQGLLKPEERYAKKYSKILGRLVWLNACSSGLSIASGISSVATLSTFIGLLISIPLGAVSGWNKCQWRGYCPRLQVPKETRQIKAVASCSTHRREIDKNQNTAVQILVESSTNPSCLQKYFAN